jgi:chaperonin GroES
MATQLKPLNDPNASGVEPLDLRVVVRPDTVEKVTAGGIILPPSKTDTDKFACQKGVLVAVGENAWEEAASRSPTFRRPLPGDRVMIGKYAGTRFKGVDGEDYVLMNDTDVIGRLAE